MRTIWAIVLGIVVTAVACLIWQDLGPIVIISILCTGGISLLVWLPLWWVVGMTIIGFFSLVGSQLGSRPVADMDSPIRKGQPLGQPGESSKPTSSDGSEPATLKPGQVLLRNYIRTMLVSYHHTRAEITERLLKKGWTRQAIDEAYQSVSANVSQDQP